MIRFACLILAALIFAATPAEAGPVATVVGALVSKVAAAWTAIGAAAIGKFAIGAALQQTILGLALSKISLMIRKNKQVNPGVKRRVETGGDKPQRVLLGHYAASGHLIFSGSWGQDGKTPRAFYQDVVLLSVLPVTALTGILVNNTRATLDRDNPHPDYGFAVTDFRRGSNDHLWIKFFDGRQTAADPMLVANYGANPDFAWTADMIGRGCAIAVITTRGNQDLWSGQPPSVIFEIDGIPLYDPSRDSSRGGSGPQRLADPATWAFSANPIAAVTTILTAGLSWQGQHLYGPRWPAHMLPPANLLAAVAACTIMTTGQDGTPEPMYRFGAELDLATDPKTFIDELLASCSADSALCEGRFLLHVGPASAPVAHFTDADCSIDHPQELDPFKGLEEVFNAVTSTFPDPAQAWATAPAPARYHPEWEAEDGGRKVASLRFPLVPWVSQIQRLETAALADQRRGRTHRVVLTPRFAHIATLDYVAWTSARNNYTAKIFKASTVRDYRTGFVELFLIEEDPDDYDPPALLPHTPEAPTRIEIPPQAVPGFVVLPWTGRDAEGVERRAGVRVLWDFEAFEDVRLIRLTFRPVGDTGEGTAIPVADAAAGERIVQDPLIPGETYQLRARLIAGRPTEWSEWQSVTVPDIRLGEADLAQSITGRIRDAEARAEAAFQRHDATLTEAEGALGALRDQLGLTLGDFIGQPLPAIPLLELMPIQIGRIDALDQQITLDLMPLVPLVPGAITRIDALQATLDLEWPRVWGAEDAIDDLRQRLSASAMELGMLGQRVTDAGVYVDPTTGQVRISGMQALDGRVTSAEIRMDGVEAQITLRATQAWVNQQISNAMFDPSQIPVLDDFELRLTTAEVALDGVNATLALKADYTLVEGLANQLSAAQVRLDGITANIALLATKTALDETSARVHATEIQLNALDAPSITFTVEATRAQFDEIDAANFATLDELMTGYRDREALRRANASAQQQLAANVQDGFAAEATARLSLQAQLANTTALVTVEQQARATADAALAQQIATLFAATGNNAAAITTEATARVDGDAALGQRIDTVQAQAGANAAAITREEEARATLAGAVAQQTGILRVESDLVDDALWATLIETITGDEDRSRIRQAIAEAQRQTTVTVQDGFAAEAAERLVLQAQIATSAALIRAEQLARATGDEALAQQLVQLQAQFGDQAALIATEVTTRANADGALGQRIDTVQAQAGDNAAAIQQEQTTRANADGALGQRLDTVQSQTEANAAAITREEEARTTLAAAVAQQTETLRVESDLVDDALWASLLDVITGDEDRSRIRQAIAEAQRQTTVTVQDGFAAEAADRLVLQAQIATSAALIRAEQLARATGDEALAQQLVQVQAQLGDQAALIATEATTRANADGAMAGQIQTVQATAESRNRTFRQSGVPADPVAGDLWFDTADGNRARRWSGTAWVETSDSRTAQNAAAIATEATARADADIALGQRIDTVQATAADNAAQIRAEETTRADADGALAGQILTVRATAESRNRTFRQSGVPAAPVTGDLWFDSADGNRARRWSGTAWVDTDNNRLAQNAAAITSEAAARADADGALGRRIDTVQAQAGDNAAAISSEATTRASADSAMAGQIEAVRVQTQDNAAAIGTEAMTRADEDAALAGQMSVVRATANSRNRSFRQSTAPANPVAGDLWFDTASGDQQLRWSGTAWLPVTDARVAQNAAAIANEAATRADADTALATQLATVSAQAGGTAATVEEQAGAIARIDGYTAATYSLRLTGGGATAAFEMVASNNPTGPASSVRIAAKNVRLDSDVEVTGDFLAKEIFATGAWIKRAAIENGAIGSAQIGNVIQSANFTEGPTGDGWQINKDGRIIANNIIIRRQIEVAAGSVNVGNINLPAGPVDDDSPLNPDWAKPGPVVWVRSTPIPITEWQGARRTYIATAGMTGGVNAPNYALPDAYWGWDAQVLPLTRWEPGDIGQSLRLRLQFWSRNVLSVSNCVVNWKIYEVS